jgi:hypothetical protein
LRNIKNLNYLVQIKLDQEGVEFLDRGKINFICPIESQKYLFYEIKTDKISFKTQGEVNTRDEIYIYFSMSYLVGVSKVAFV